MNKKNRFISFALATILLFSVNSMIVRADEEIITDPDILEEIWLGELELLAQLVEAEAGNQDLTGKRYVADVVLNRVDSPDFPDTIAEVIYQDHQFGPVMNDALEKAGWGISDESFEAVRLEIEERLNYDIVFFNTEKSPYAQNHFKYQDHWFDW